MIYEREARPNLTVLCMLYLPTARAVTANGSSKATIGDSTSLDTHFSFQFTILKCLLYTYTNYTIVHICPILSLDHATHHIGTAWLLQCLHEPMT